MEKELINISNSEITVKPKPINLSNLLSWAKHTAAADRNYYKVKNRSISARRLWCMLTPNLQEPIFIIGSPRSGTTFLGSCIGELPEISYHFEPVATKAAARYIYEGEWEMPKAKWFYRNVYAWLMRLHFDADLRFAEKTPRNCFLINYLYQAFPDARFIHIIRDGRDAALSHSKKPWLQATSAQSGQRESGGYRYGPYPRFWVEAHRVREFGTTSDIHRCIWAWRRHTESALQTLSNLPNDRYHELKYEKLVVDPTTEADRLLRFLGILDSKSCDLFRKALAKAKPDSVDRWKHELSNNQLQQIEIEAGNLLRRLGYIS
jgi:hypothetical protein